MNQLPNVENAIINISKLRDYCLNPHHPVGKHKARVFKSELGIDQGDAELLKERILSALPHSSAKVDFNDKYGTRYTVVIKIRIVRETMYFNYRLDYSFGRKHSSINYMLS